MFNNMTRVILFLFLFLRGLYPSERTDNVKADMTRAGAFSARLETGILFAGASGIAYPLFNSSALYDVSEDETEAVNARIHNYETSDEWVSLLSNDFMFDLSYLFENNVEIYLGSPFYDNDREGLTAGIATELEDKSRIDISLFGGSMSVWKDPYLLHVKRKQTCQYTLGTQGEYARIAGTGFSLLCKFKTFLLADDEAEERDSRLDREGTAADVTLRHSFNLSPSHTLIPGICLTRSDMKGQGLSYNGHKLELCYSYEDNKNVVYTAFSFQKNHYEEIHPVFNRKMKDQQIWGGLIMTRFDIFGVTDLYSRWGIGYGNLNNEIDFYDLKAFLSFFNIGYLF